MTSAGWILMLGSVSGVVALTAYCFWRVLTTPRAKGHIHATLDIDTHERLE